MSSRVMQPLMTVKKRKKEQFYTRLQSVLEKCLEKDVTILMGDLNAKIGIDNTGYEEIIENHGLGDMNEKFAGLCALNDLVISGSVFLQEYTKQRWCLRTPKQRTRLIMSAVLRGFRGPCM